MNEAEQNNCEAQILLLLMFLQTCKKIESLSGEQSKLMDMMLVESSQNGSKILKTYVCMVRIPSQILDTYSLHSWQHFPV